MSTNLFCVYHKGWSETTLLKLYKAIPHVSVGPLMHNSITINTKSEY